MKERANTSSLVAFLVSCLAWVLGVLGGVLVTGRAEADLTVTVGAGVEFVRHGDEWRFFRGTTPPLRAPLRASNHHASARSEKKLTNGFESATILK